MPTAAITEGRHPGEYIGHEYNQNHCRDNVTVKVGEKLDDGAVVARVGSGFGRTTTTYTGTGNGTLTGIAVDDSIEVGAYLIKAKTAEVNGGVFSVTTPGGQALPDATVGTPYVSDHLRFTLNDGATDFIVNDQFTVTIAAGNPVVAGTGNGTISGISVGSQVKPGRYRVRAVAAGTNTATFETIDPDGESLGQTPPITGGAGGTTAFTSDQINYTVTDGSTDFAIGDTFDIVVWGATGGEIVEWDPTNAADGRNIVAGIHYGYCDATDAALRSVISARGPAEIIPGMLQYRATVTDGQKQQAIRALERLGMIPTVGNATGVR